MSRYPQPNLNGAPQNGSTQNYGQNMYAQGQQGFPGQGYGAQQQGYDSYQQGYDSYQQGYNGQQQGYNAQQFGGTMDQGGPQTSPKLAPAAEHKSMRPLPPEMNTGMMQGVPPPQPPLPGQQHGFEQQNFGGAGAFGDPQGNVGALTNGLSNVSLLDSGSNVQQQFNGPQPGFSAPQPYGTQQASVGVSRAPPRPNAMEKECGTPREIFRPMQAMSAVGSAPPPSANTDYLAVDDGSATPRYLRLTVNSIPEDSNLNDKASIPLGVIVTPFADPEAGEQMIPEVDLTTAGNGGPLRCSKCRGYANPGFRFIDSGSRFYCNLCGHVNDTPPEHMCATNPGTGLRVDADTRHEFRYGSVDYVVGNSDYFASEAGPPHYVFCIDVSASALLTGFTAIAVQSLLSVLEGEALPGASSGAKVGIITFDQSLHFYDVRGGSGGSIYYVTDVDEPFQPLGPEAFYATPERAAAILKTITTTFSLYDPSQLKGGTPPSGCALGAALVSAKQALSDLGGKVFAMTGGLPTTGVGKLERRGGATSSEEREKALLHDDNSFYEDLGSELSDMQISVDLFIATQLPYVDTATLMRLPRACGGRSFYIPEFDVRKDDICLRQSIVRAIWGTRAFEAMVRVRVSQGLETGEFLGSFGRPQRRSDVSAPVMGIDSVMAIAIKHEGQIPHTTGSAGFSTNAAFNNVCVQCAVLYTDIGGRRKIRVHTMFVPKTNVLQDCFRSADPDAIVSFLAMRAATAAISGQKLLSKVREAVIEKTAHILFVYRKFCNSANSPTSQLILPETLKLLPVITLGILKSPAFRPQPTAQNGPGAVSPDERAAALIFLGTGKPQDIVTYGYPRMVSAVNLPEPAGLPLPDGIGDMEPIALPPSVPLSSEFIQDNELFIVDTGMSLVVWAGPNVDQEAFNDVLDGSTGVLRLRLGEENMSDRGSRVAAIVARILESRSNLTRIHITMKGSQDGSDMLFFQPLFIEDKTVNAGQGGWSYHEFLKHSHRRIMEKMAQERAQRDLQTWDMLSY